MDFAWLIWASVFLVHLCYGQDEALSFEVSIPGDSTKKAQTGDTPVFLCVATKDSTGQLPKLTWYRDDQLVVNGLDGVKLQKFSPERLALIFEALEEDDSSMLTCEGELNGQKASATVQLVVIPQVNILSSPDQFGFLGKDGVLECKSSGAHEKIWKFMNDTDIVSNAKYVKDGDTVTIKDLTFEDAGQYSCGVFDFLNMKSKNLIINFAVVDPPKIPVPPTIQPNNPKVGDEVKITCTAEGTPKPTFLFKRGENPISGNEMESVDEANGILTLKSITSNSEGEYTCIAKNRGGTVESTTKLDVQIPPTILDMETAYNTVQEESVDITCTSEGDPAPSMLWRKVGQAASISDAPNTDGPQVISEPSTEPADAMIKRVGKVLRFSKVQPSDAGQYICEATSNAGRANKTIEFQVKYAPHFNTDYKEKLFYGWKGHKANLTCMASANEVANFKWYIPDGDSDNVADAQMIQNNARYTVGTVQKFPEYFLSSSSLLVTINDNDPSIYRDYLCEADNGQSATQRVTLKEATAPGEPTLTIVNTMSTIVEMKINEPVADGGQPITSYKYSYYAQGEADRKQVGVLEGDDISEYPIVFKIKQLKPSTGYVIEVSASNVVSAGPSLQVTFDTAEVSAPSILSITSSKIGLEPNAYTLQWAQPEDGGSPITQFTIEYQKVQVNEAQDSSSWNPTGVDGEKKTDTIENDAGALEYKLTGLQSNSYYDVSVVATNAVGSSAPARRIIKTSAGGTGSSTAAAAGMSSVIVIAIIIGIIILLFIVVLVIYLVCKKRRQQAGKGGEAEGGAKEDGKDQAEEEKLIKKDDKLQVENETGGAGESPAIPISEPEEYEPDNKPDANQDSTTAPPATESEPAPAAETPAPEKPAEPAAVETSPEVKVTPEPADKPDAPTA